MGADRFIERLPSGYHHELGERGRSLSVGERQLLSFARALALDPRILVLDEATSSVDAEAEAQIQRAIAELMAGRTSLVVAHRLSTILHADEILVLASRRDPGAGQPPRAAGAARAVRAAVSAPTARPGAASNCLTRVCLRGYGPRVRLSATGFSPRIRSMMHLEIGGARIPVPAGETIIGSAPGCAIVLEGEGVQPRHAILQGTPQGAAAIRAGEPGAELLVNGVPARRRSHPRAPRRQDPDRSARAPRGRRPPRGQHPAVRFRRLHRPRPAGARLAAPRPDGRRPAAGWSA